MKGVTSMLKKTLALLLVLCVVASLMLPVVLAETAYGTSIMYVDTPNRKSLNVREAPSKDAKIIGSAQHGNSILIDWSYAGNDGWTRVVWGSLGDGYVMTRYLSSTKPTTAPVTADSAKKEADDAKAAQDKLNKELKSEKEVDSYYIAVRPSRTSGWVNFRVGPSTITSRITSYGQGKELIVLAETNNWYRARDPETNKIGYISKNYSTKINKAVTADVTEYESQALGKLTVNGEFNLVCKLPATYKLQVTTVRGESIIASILSDDMTKPQMYLSIAYDDMYGTVDRMNDMSDEDLAVLEESFREMNDVDISYGKTDLGTKLLIARETGSDTDFVDILTVYKGYFIEFNMTPNPKAADQTLTNEQIGMCIDFLTNLDFVPAE